MLDDAEEKDDKLSEDAKTVVIPEREDSALLFSLAHWGGAKGCRNCARSWTIFQGFDEDLKTFRAVAAVSRKNWDLLRYFFCCQHTADNKYLGRVTIFPGLGEEAGTQQWYPGQVCSTLTLRESDQCRCGSNTARHVICEQCIEDHAELRAYMDQRNNYEPTFDESD